MRIPKLSAAILAGLLAAGCMTTRIEEAKDSSTGIAKGESVVVLASSYHSSDPAEDTFMACVRDRMDSGRGKLQIHSGTEFRDALYPWLEPRTAPRSVEQLPELLDRPGVNERIRQRGIRYVVWIKGDTEQTSSGGSLSCAAGPGGGGCFGLAWWEDEATYEAIVWDLYEGVRSGSISANVNGTSVIPAVVIPVPLIARTRAAACKGLSRQLQVFIAGS